VADPGRGDDHLHPLCGAPRQRDAHYFKYYVGTQPLTLPSFLPKSIAGTQQWGWESLVSMYNTSTQFASLVGVMLIPFAARMAGRKTAFVILFVIAICCTASFYLLKPDQLLLMFTMNCIGSITGGPLIALMMSMYADTADYGEYVKHRRPQASFSRPRSSRRSRLAVAPGWPWRS